MGHYFRNSSTASPDAAFFVANESEKAHNARMTGPNTVQQIKDRLNIVDVVSQYVKLQRSGGTFKARCPFHNERTPSFHVSPERGTYHCFGCNVGGDMFSFIEAIEGIDFKGALKILAEKANVPLVYEHRDKQEVDVRDRLFEVMEAATAYYIARMTPMAKEYLTGRGLTEATVRVFRLGWAGNAWSEASEHLKKQGFSEKEIVDAGLAKRNERGSLVDKFRNRIMFPIGDTAGRIIAFSGRTFGPDASPEAPKYLNSPETPLFTKSRILYGFDKAKLPMRKLGCAVLVEGQMDLIMSHQAGWENTVAVSGTAFTREHAVLIKRMTENLVVALDADEAGFKAASRAARAALQAGLNVKVAAIPDEKDPADLILKEGKDAWAQAIREASDIIHFLLDTLQKHTPQQDRFRRSVEAIVLPFLADVQSPIAKEQYMQEISKRLGVSETAVQQALSRVPIAPVAAPETESPRPAPPAFDDQELLRARQAYAIVLREAQLPEARLDIAGSLEALKEAVGDQVFAKLEALSPVDKERLRFSVEQLFPPDRSPKPDFLALVRVLKRERLKGELNDIAYAQNVAESKGDEEAAAVLLEQYRVLTTAIAKLDKQE